MQIGLRHIHLIASAISLQCLLLEKWFKKVSDAMKVECKYGKNRQQTFKPFNV